MCGICTGRAAWGTVQLHASAACSLQSVPNRSSSKLSLHNKIRQMDPSTPPSSPSSSSSEAGEGVFGTAWRPIATPRRPGRELGKRDPSVGVPVLQIAPLQRAGGLHASVLVSYLFPGNASPQCPHPPNPLVPHHYYHKQKGGVPTNLSTTACCKLVPTMVR